MLGKGWGISIRNKYSFYNRMLLIQYGCNKTCFINFNHRLWLLEWLLFLSSSHFIKRERGREKERLWRRDDLLFFKIMQICSFLKYSNKIKGTACSSLTRKSNTNYNGCWEPCIFCTGLQWSAERSNKIKPEIEHR